MSIFGKHLQGLIFLLNHHHQERTFCPPNAGLKSATFHHLRLQERCVLREIQLYTAIFFFKQWSKTQKSLEATQIIWHERKTGCFPKHTFIYWGLRRCLESAWRNTMKYIKQNNKHDNKHSCLWTVLPLMFSVTLWRLSGAQWRGKVWLLCRASNTH